jgi:hypothetical protein
MKTTITILAQNCRPMKWLDVCGFLFETVLLSSKLCLQAQHSAEAQEHGEEWYTTTRPRMSNVFGILSMYMEPDEVLRAPQLHQAICNGDFDKVDYSGLSN